jgi:hypothetical protein
MRRRTVAVKVVLSEERGAYGVYVRTRRNRTLHTIVCDLLGIHALELCCRRGEMLLIESARRVCVRNATRRGRKAAQPIARASRRAA